MNKNNTLFNVTAIVAEWRKSAAERRACVVNHNMEPGTFADGVDTCADVLEHIQPVTADGISLRDYFIAHAPAEPWPWFQPQVTDPPPTPQYEQSGVWGFNKVEQVQAGELRKNRSFNSFVVNTGCEKYAAFEAAWNAYWESERLWKDTIQQARQVQWPAFWADTMLAQRGGAK